MNDLASVIQMLTVDIENQVTGLKESSIAMDSIASGVQQIAESSTSVARLAEETSHQANDGVDVIEKSVIQMTTINQVVEDTSIVVDRLVERTGTIDHALKAITAIAEQTNLLALNASIEAARAGEQGRGFAVVAEEVAKLASQSKVSASEINHLLQEIHRDTQEVIHSMEKGKLESRQGIEVIDRAGNAFKHIVEQVEIMTEQVREVSSTVEDMSAGTEEVNTSLADVVSTSEKIAEKTEEIANVSTQESVTVGEMVHVAENTKVAMNELEVALQKFKTEE